MIDMLTFPPASVIALIGVLYLVMTGLHGVISYLLGQSKGN